jgi:hypothetical protein
MKKGEIIRQHQQLHKTTENENFASSTITDGRRRRQIPLNVNGMDTQKNLKNEAE